MFKLLFILFITVPLIEIYLFIEIGNRLGALPTIGLILFTAILGAIMLRLQGLITLAKIRQALDSGELPAISLVEGLILLIAGALLLTPGFFTDTIGFLCMLPGLRHKLATTLLERYFRLRAQSQNEQQPVVIEGEFREDHNRNEDHQHRLDS